MAIQNFNKPITVKASTFGKVMWYISFILIVPIFFHIGNRNNIKRMKTKINQADSEIDVQLTKRRDMLVKLVDATKSAMNFEKQILNEIVELRSKNFANLPMSEKNIANSSMDKINSGINVQLEAYPDLKSNQNIIELQRAIIDVEEDIAASRRIYNSNVSYFNQSIQSYPMSVAADGETTYIFFEASEAQKQDVKIDLGM